MRYHLYQDQSKGIKGIGAFFIRNTSIHNLDSDCILVARAPRGGLLTSGRADIVPTILKSKQTIQGNDETKLGDRFDNDPWDAPSISDALNSTSKHAVRLQFFLTALLGN